MRPMSITAYLALSLSLLSLTAPVFGETGDEPLTEVRLTPGAMYMEWGADEETLTCGILIQSPTETYERNDPVQVVYLVDISRTMEGKPIRYAKDAGLAIIEGLRDGDYFSLVTFSEFARVVFPMQPLGGGVRRAARTAVESLGDETHRNLSEGLKVAAEQFGRFRGRASAGRHLFLLTRNSPDKGETDPASILNKASSLKEEHEISISTFGIDTSFNEDLLHAMAAKTGGRYHFVEFQDHPHQLVYRVNEEINRVSKASARNVRIEIIPPGSAEVKGVEGGYRKDGHIHIGDMRAGRRQMVVFDLVGRPSRQKECEIWVRYLEPDGVTRREVRTYLDIPLVEGKSRFTKKMAPYLLTYDLQMSLVETVENMRKNRQAFASLFRKNRQALEQENVLLNSDYLKKQLVRFQKLEDALANTAISISMIIKDMKYTAQQLLLDN